MTLFTIRVIQIGGFDPSYRDPQFELLKPLRDDLSRAIFRILPYPESRLLSAIILGVEKIPHNLKIKLQDTATIHIMVVSGQNLTMLAGWVMSLAPFLGRKKAVGITLTIVGFYSVLTGLQVPVVRAAIMVTLTYLAQILGKEKVGWWVLTMTAGAMLLVNPNWLFTLSFQLSFLATLGVVVVSPPLLGYLKILPRLIREDVAVTTAAQLMVLPIIAHNFYQLSLFGILVNSLILWTVPIIMVWGVIAMIVGLVNAWLGQIIGLIPSVLLTYFMYLVDFFSNLPYTLVYLPGTSILVWIGYYLVMGAVVWVLYKKARETHDT